MKKILLVASAALFLTGCTQFAATAVTDSQAAHNAAYEYVSENIRIRRAIREKCLDLAMREVDALISAGDFKKARLALKRAYPPLFTMDLIRQKTGALDEASVCG